MGIKFPGNPILLFGLPRSGTSWVAKIFDSHPDVFYLHEPDKTIRARGLTDCMSESVSREELESLMEQVAVWLNCTKSSVIASRPVFKKNFDGTLMQIYRSNAYLFGKLLEKAGLDISIPAAARARSDDVRVVWKSINSSGRLGVLATQLPKSRGVLILRHPCGEIASVLRNERRNPQMKAPASQDLGIYESLSQTETGVEFGFSLEKAKTLTAAERLAWRWKILSDHAVGQVKDLSNVHVLSYDAACADPLNASKQLFTFCGLNWSEQTESFIRLSTAPDKEDPRYFAVSKDPLNAANKWKKELTREEKESIFAVLEDSVAFKHCVAVD